MELTHFDFNTSPIFITLKQLREGVRWWLCLTIVSTSSSFFDIKFQIFWQKKIWVNWHDDEAIGFYPWILSSSISIVDDCLYDLLLININSQALPLTDINIQYHVFNTIQLMNVPNNRTRHRAPLIQVFRFLTRAITSDPR